MRGATWKRQIKEDIYELAGGLCSWQIKACAHVPPFPHYKTKRCYYM